MSKNIDINKKILNDIKKQYNKAIKEFAEEITFQIESAYESIIEQFYLDYIPKYYDRTYSTYLGSDRYNDIFGITPSGNGYLAGINVSPSNIPGNPYRADKDWVFDRTFSQGIHGFTYAEIVQKTRKKELIRKWMKANTKKSLREYVDQGLFQYASLTLSSGKKIKNAKINIKVPHQMRKTSNLMFLLDDGKPVMANNINLTTSPKSMMNGAFKRITKKKNMNEIFNNILKKYI